MITVTSFGYGHSEPPNADITLDVRTSLRNPHADPAMRELTGLDAPVRDHVMATPGALNIVIEAATLARSLASIGKTVRVAVGCVGGRHRSVALAEEIAAELVLLHCAAVDVEHRDVTKPVIQK